MLARHGRITHTHVTENIGHLRMQAREYRPEEYRSLPGKLHFGHVWLSMQAENNVFKGGYRSLPDAGERITCTKVARRI